MIYKIDIQIVYLSLKCAELRCKKSLHWQTYSLLTNQSKTNNGERRDKIIVHRGHIQHSSGPPAQLEPSTSY